MTSLQLRLSIAQGTVSADEVRMDGPAVRLVLAGKATVPARDLDFTGTASLVSAASEGPSFELPFMLRGVWDEPLMLLDTQSLIRRAPAAAPLLDALRKRSTIDRFVGT